jgi:hypothetical protein
VANCDSGREYFSGQWWTMEAIVDSGRGYFSGQWWTVETIVDSGGQL